jgi:hypothetical protein
VTLTWSAKGETAAALREHADLIAREVLAVSTHEVEQLDGGQHDGGLGVTFQVEKV